MIAAAYVVALVLVDMAALSLHPENTFGVFHELAVASLVTIGAGLSPLLLDRRSPPVIATHGCCMARPYVGLVVVASEHVPAPDAHQAEDPATTAISDSRRVLDGQHDDRVKRTDPSSSGGRRWALCCSLPADAVGNRHPTLQRDVSSTVMSCEGGRLARGRLPSRAVLEAA